MAVRKTLVRNAMENWLALNENIQKLDTDEVIYALELENQRSTPRKTFLKRLTQRYNGIRGEEIRRELE